MTAERPASRSASTARMSVGHFIEVSRWPKKRCLAPSKALRAAALARGLLVAPPLVIRVASSASSRLAWMILNAWA